ncbi:unnamed protein product [Penicillium salamii]|nr:unnamed protein product [Penicillium salamii]
MGKKTKAQKAKAKEPPSIPTTNQEQPPTDLPTPPYDKSGFDETDFPPLPHSSITDAGPIQGGRKDSQEVDDTVGAVGDLAKGSAGGLQIPGKTDTGGKDDKGSLQIKIHLNLHAKVKLELDAQVYGDIVIGLL